MQMGCTSLLAMLIFQPCVVAAIANFAPGLIAEKKIEHPKEEIERLKANI